MVRSDYHVKIEDRGQTKATKRDQHGVVYITAPSFASATQMLLELITQEDS